MSTNIFTIDGHVLLPHQADWSRSPSQKRVWRSNVAAALTGFEDRSSLRSGAWLNLSYDVLPTDHVERARLEDRARAAARAAKVAVPHWGMGCALNASVEAEDADVVFDRSNHGFAKGTLLFFQSSEPSAYDEWDVAVVAVVGGDGNVTLSSGLGFSYRAGDFAWPLLLGKPALEKFSPVGNRRATYQVGIQFDRRPVLPVSYETFAAYPEGPPVSLLKGEGWAGPWVFG